MEHVVAARLVSASCPQLSRDVVTLSQMNCFQAENATPQTREAQRILNAVDAHFVNQGRTEPEPLGQATPAAVADEAAPRLDDEAAAADGENNNSCP